MPAPQSRRVAVIGSGVAGLSAAHVASASASVTLYEADDRLGGHADTHLVARPGRAPLAIDTGFIVHNKRTYPTLLRLFAELGVATQESDMSMSVRDDETGLEWAGALGAAGRPPDLADGAAPAATCGCSPRSRGSTAGRGRCSRPGSADGEGGRRPDPAGVPARRRLLGVLHPPLHGAGRRRGLVHATRTSRWTTPRATCSPSSTTTACSASSARRSGARSPGARGSTSPGWPPGSPTSGTGTKVTSVLETPDGVEVTDGNGEVTTYDAVVVATHPGQALALLAEPTPVQREVLGALPYSRQHRAAAHRHPAAAAAPSAPGRRGTSAARPGPAGRSPSPTT